MSFEPDHAQKQLPAANPSSTISVVLFIILLIAMFYFLA
jgi:preprotein translocase subunit YajC